MLIRSKNQKSHTPEYAPLTSKCVFDVNRFEGLRVQYSLQRFLPPCSHHGRLKSSSFNGNKRTMGKQDLARKRAHTTQNVLCQNHPTLQCSPHDLHNLRGPTGRTKTSSKPKLNTNTVARFRHRVPYRVRTYRAKIPRYKRTSSAQ